MTEPTILTQAVKDWIADFLERHGIDLTVPPPAGHDTDDLTDPNHIQLATEYTARHVPARYATATADHPAILDWIEQLTRQAAVQSARHVGVFIRTGPSLLILGPTGTGKTHQAYGAFRLIAAAGVRARWVAVSAADLYARLRPRHGIDSEAEFRTIADAPLLLVDDLGAAKNSEWVEEVNYRLVNWRYERNLATVFTSNIPPKELAETLGDRVASRLAEMTTRVVLDGPDRRRAGASSGGLG